MIARQRAAGRSTHPPDSLADVSFFSDPMVHMVEAPQSPSASAKAEAQGFSVGVKIFADRGTQGAQFFALGCPFPLPPDLMIS